MTVLEPQQLLLASHLFDDLWAGRKRCTVRRGARLIEPGKLRFVEPTTEPGSVGPREAIVIVRDVQIKRVRDLDDRDARADGAGSPIELYATLRQFYPDLEPQDIITVVHHGQVLKGDQLAGIL